MLKFVLMTLLCGMVATAQTWVQKVPFSGLGNSLSFNPLNHNVVYGSPGNNRIHISRDRGYSWQLFGTAIPLAGTDPNIIKSIAVSPRDTLKLLVGVESSGASLDRIMRTTNGGLTWTQTWAGSFSYYGRPVEFKPEHPDTVYTMGNDTIWRSVNFGATWDTMTVRRGSGLFNAWCDAQIRPDSANILLVGDAGTGIWKSTDYGATWRKVYTAISNGEIPSIAIDPLNPRVAYATRFSGGGGLMKSTDGGETWFVITTPLGFGSSWWVACSPVNRGYVYFGVYTTNPGGVYVSADSGLSWRNFKTGFSSSANFNYGLLVRDSLTVIASQATGIYKLEYPASLRVLSPNGGEAYAAGRQRTITWSIVNLEYARIEFSSNNGSTWSLLADSIPSSQTSYIWTVPGISSSQCRIRVLDPLFTSTKDTSDGTFSIVPVAVVAPNGGEVWYAGSTQGIAWNAVDLVSVDLTLSTDSGLTWQPIATRPATSSPYLWHVPNLPSTTCLIRLRGTEDSSVVEVSDEVFSIVFTNEFRAALRIQDAGGGADTLRFGTAAGARDTIDGLLGEAPLGPKPAPGIFDARWQIPTMEETMEDYRDTIGGVHEANTFLAEFQPGPGGYPFTLTWEPESLKSEIILLRDVETHGSLLTLDMRRVNSIVVSDTSMMSVEIVQCQSEAVTVGGNSGWSLISVPLIVGDRRKASIFPYSLSVAYSYANNYIEEDTLEYGMGYWLKLPSTSVTGCRRMLDTIEVRQGWNIVGSLSSAVAVSALQPIPDSIIASNFFGYTTGYAIADSLLPGRGYWVKSSAPGKIVLSSSLAVPKFSRPEEIRRSNSLTIQDREGGEQTLYISERVEGEPLSFGEMPPPAPDGQFDARFAPNSMICVYSKNMENGQEFPILLSGVSKKIFFSWKVENEGNFIYILLEKSGSTTIAETRLTGTGSLLVQRNTQSTFAVRIQRSIGNVERPREFVLGEMYPNPFNPTTHVEFELPTNAFVLIKMYSILGEEVATLIEEDMATGIHATEWNGVGNDGRLVSSGVYYLRMSAIARSSAGMKLFTDTRNILLLK